MYHHELNPSDIIRNVGSPKHDDQFDVPDIYVNSVTYKNRALLFANQVLFYKPIEIPNQIHF